ncbi:hypothetical protein F4819DRAFT_478553 [Hypoxylon fuscum]|nr:hypothetical protein F4819DRAFT_478553 [Hypoxylon fuscum]
MCICQNQNQNLSALTHILAPGCTVFSPSPVIYLLARLLLHTLYTYLYLTYLTSYSGNVAAAPVLHALKDYTDTITHQLYNT